MHQFPEPFQSAAKQAADSRFTAAELPRDLGDRAAVQVFQFHGRPLIIRQLGQRPGEVLQLLVLHRMLAGRRLLGRQ